MNEVFRTEQKYLLDHIAYRQCLHYFSRVLTPDHHNGQSGYWIRSLYFDTPGNTDFWQKQNGDELRKKLRLRLYALDSPTVLLEMKQKEGANQKKRSLLIHRNAAQQLMAGHYTVLLPMKDPFAQECYVLLSTGCYRPKAIIEYRRQAFVTQEANTRITFDTDVRACETGLNLFAPQLPLTPVMDSSLAVLELKYNGFLLSYLQEAVNRTNKSALSVSKYCMGRNLLL